MRNIVLAVLFLSSGCDDPTAIGEAVQYAPQHFAGLVDPANACELLLCEDCPTDVCVHLGVLDLCADPITRTPVCGPLDNWCSGLMETCAGSGDCVTGAPLCLDFKTGEPWTDGVDHKGRCVAPCDNDLDCGSPRICLGDGFCGALNGTAACYP